MWKLQSKLANGSMREREREREGEVCVCVCVLGVGEGGGGRAQTKQEATTAKEVMCSEAGSAIPFS